MACTLNDGMPANLSFTITIANLRNPLKVGGTGNFQVKTQINSFTIDENTIFGSLGIAPAPLGLIDPKVEFDAGASKRAGEVSSYVISFIPSDNLPENIIFRITFPLIYTLTYLRPTQCSSTTKTSVR